MKRKYEERAEIENKKSWALYSLLITIGEMRSTEIRKEERGREEMVEY